MDVKRAKAKVKVKAGNIPGNSSNHNSNAASAVRVAEESRGVVNPENRPKGFYEAVSPSIERMGGLQTLELLQICSPCPNRIEQLLEANSKRTIHPPLT